MAPAITKNMQGGTTNGALQMSNERYFNEAASPTSGAQASRRGIIPGFLLPSSPLPKDIDHEAIIKHYPNHLRGKLLLEIAATWTPIEISQTSGRPELKANTIVKRIKAAKTADGHHRKTAQRQNKSAKRAAPTQQIATPTATAIQEPPSPLCPLSPPPPPAANNFTESQASLKFLEEQLAIQSILKELDPEWIDRQSGTRKKSPPRDRILVQRAVAEYERRRMVNAGVMVEVIEVN